VVRVEIYANLELVAVIEAPPYRADLQLPPAESLILTVESIDADAQRATATRTVAVRAPVDMGVDLAMPEVDAAACSDCGSDHNGCSMSGHTTPRGAGAFVCCALLALAVSAVRRREAESRHSTFRRCEPE